MDRLKTTTAWQVWMTSGWLAGIKLNIANIMLFFVWLIRLNVSIESASPTKTALHGWKTHFPMSDTCLTVSPEENTNNVDVLGCFFFWMNNSDDYLNFKFVNPCNFWNQERRSNDWLPLGLMHSRNKKINILTMWFKCQLLYNTLHHTASLS